ncbi:MAG: S41 family peptidase [Sphaerochaetaceae bacterium]|jgi:hypothetical protein|nr:S41 family peptidase [Sphaerochaetaceae bacterium]
MKKAIALGCLLVLLFLSCSINQLQDPSSYLEDPKTWKGVFEGFWNGMNNNYVFWEIDSPEGQWDEIYKKYAPRFEEKGLVDFNDRETTKEAVLDLFEMVKGLHDGHYVLTVDTGDSISDISFMPSAYQRVVESEGLGSLTDREILGYFYDNYKVGPAWFIADYLNERFMPMGDGFPSIIDSTFGISRPYDICPSMGAAVNAFWSSDDLGNGLSESIDKSKLHFTTTLAAGKSRTMLDAYFKQWVLIFFPLEEDGYNLTCFAGITRQTVINGTQVPENVLYLSFSSFKFLTHMEDEHIKAFLELYQNAKRSDGTVGMIIDLRGNPGGYILDREILFADLVETNHQYSWDRIKLGGDNRLDYSPWLPSYLYASSNGEAKALAQKPIAVLTNSGSVSNSEHTAMLFKTFPKGVSIGGTTYGGYGALSQSYKEENAGIFNVGDIITLVYTPFCETKSLDGSVREGIGVPPNIAVEYDDADFLAGKDERLLSSFDYIKANI